VTILGFILSFIGLIYVPLGIAFSFPVWLILTYIFKLIDLFSKTTFANVVLEDVSFMWVFISYLFFGLLIWKNLEAEKLKYFK
jgi:hypothetical protein